MAKDAAGKTLVIIDGKSVFYRGFYAMPGLANADGLPTGGVYGFASMVFDMMARVKPDYMCVAWDKSKTNIRSRQKIYADYKAGRKPAPTEFHMQIPALHKFVDAMGWPLYELDDYEADDIMGTLAKEAGRAGINVVLVTSDHDVLQLLDDQIKVLILKRGLTNTVEFDVKLFESEYGIKVAEMDDFKALRGDPSDNIPGVKGIGEKGAKQLINQYKDLETIYENIELIPDKLASKLKADKDMAYISRELVAIMCDAPVELELEALRTDQFDYEAIIAVLKELDFRSLLRRVPEIFALDDEQVQTNDELTNGVAFKTADKPAEVKVDWKEPVFVDAYFSDDNRVADSYFIGQGEVVYEVDAPLDPGLAKKLVKAKLWGHDVKRVLRTIDDCHKVKVEYDTMIAGFVIDSRVREATVSQLASRFLGLNVSDAVDAWPPDENEVVMPKRYALVREIMGAERTELDGDKQRTHVLFDIDLAVLPVLARAEQVGMLLDPSVLEVMSNQINDQVSDLEQSIYGLAGEEFNIASPAQLSRILFEVLKLNTKGIRKTKTSYSTAASELAKLHGQHEIIDMISSYRELSKLRNTYVDVLPSLVDKQSRVHTVFNLTTAQTGRLSSHDPNLQNIPVRTEFGRKIREAFIAGKGRKIIQADYSQFELRLAAALSKDEDLVKVFADGADIHTATAAQVFEVPIDEVTKEQRYMAKAVNFGVLYGQGPHGLAEGAGISYGEAIEFIEKYYELRPNLRQYYDELVVFAGTSGYVENIFGRRRYVDDINSKNYMLREAAKRAIMNMPMQSTAADITKLAMVEVAKILPDGAELIMQVHDSIMVECDAGDAKGLADEIKKAMEGVYDIDVPLAVDVSVGDHWGQL